MKLGSPQRDKHYIWNESRIKGTGEIAAMEEAAFAYIDCRGSSQHSSGLVHVNRFLLTLLVCYQSHQYLVPTDTR